MKLLRERLLAQSHRTPRHLRELVKKLLAWRHPGFSTHVAEAIPFEDQKAVEHVACYGPQPLVTPEAGLPRWTEGGALSREKVVAYVSDGVSIKRILDALDLSPLEEQKPPPIREVVRVPMDEERREIQVG